MPLSQGTLPNRYEMSNFMRREKLLICKRITHALRVEFADHAPKFIALCVKVYEGGGKLKIVHGGEFHTYFFLNVDMNDEDVFSKFFFELVHDGLHRHAAYSIWRLELKQDGFA